MNRRYEPTIIQADCTRALAELPLDAPRFDVTFLDPPFNQGKDYRSHNDRMSESDYWEWMRDVCRLTRERSSLGAAMYFMQREKNTEQVLEALRASGWHLQNLIIWKKKTSAVPSTVRFGKAYQVIAYATNGKRARAFNRLRIDPPMPAGYQPRPRGMFVTDIWDDIRELTSGYYAGDEALRAADGERAHKQQSPVSLLLRILLSSSEAGDCAFDPFSGTGTTAVVAQQMGRRSVGIEKDETNVRMIRDRLKSDRPSDDVERYRSDYRFTDGLSTIWPINDASTPQAIPELRKEAQPVLVG